KAVRRRCVPLLFITGDKYPRQLLNCYDPPTLLYYKGSIDLNQPKMLSVVGTRHHTEYGRRQTEAIIGELGSSGVTIVSGMAYGIDGLAHRAALQSGLPTLGVLAHGLHTIYPPEHRSLAEEILAKGGGFITEFPPGCKPDRFNFPIRNRIVAGISPALLVIETGRKGGSMITAALAGGYNSQVYALPGRRSDLRSEGCNFLLHNRTAALFYSVQSFYDMNWAGRQRKAQLDIPFVLDEAESIIANLLGVTEPCRSTTSMCSRACRRVPRQAPFFRLKCETSSAFCPENATSAAFERIQKIHLARIYRLPYLCTWQQERSLPISLISRTKLLVKA
ncbi:MAG: DNA-processing protein DprA, partial [Flavihumibacter sp.]